METADPRRGKVLKGKTLPYGTLTMSEEDSVIRSAYYNYGYRNDEDMPALPHIESDDQVVDPEEELWEKEKQAYIKDLLDGLNRREAKVLRMRYGIELDHDMSLEEVGRTFDVSRERIRQIEAHALRKLKHPDRNLREVIYPENSFYRRKQSEARLRERMFEIEMTQMGWAWYQRQLDGRISFIKHPKSNSWIEHIKLTNPNLHRRIEYEVNRYLNDIFTNRLRTPVHDGRERFEGSAQAHAKP
jgi:DNA-binding CsgD family transcriptional regulator